MKFFILFGLAAVSMAQYGAPAADATNYGVAAAAPTYGAVASAPAYTAPEVVHTNIVPVPVYQGAHHNEPAYANTWRGKDHGRFEDSLSSTRRFYPRVPYFRDYKPISNPFYSGDDDHKHHHHGDDYRHHHHGDEYRHHHHHRHHHKHGNNDYDFWANYDY